MFSPTEDLSRAPQPWRAALRNAAGLAVAFATLDSYPLSRVPHGSSSGADAPFDIEAVEVLTTDPHGRVDRVLGSARRRGHGAVASRPAVCLHGQPAASRAAAGPAVTPASGRSLSRN